jgi:pimeloyl-ACP methyl ester carboxylesterase
MDDVRAVMDAVGSERAALMGVSEGGPLCSLFATTYPSRTLALVMIGTYAKRLWAPDYPWGPTRAERERFFDEIRTGWGGPVGIGVRAPSRAGDPAFREWWSTYLRMGASPGAALTLTQMNAGSCGVLPAIACRPGAAPSDQCLNGGRPLRSRAHQGAIFLGCLATTTCRSRRLDAMLDVIRRSWRAARAAWPIMCSRRSARA